jgi:hypothetical protein
MCRIRGWGCGRIAGGLGIEAGWFRLRNFYGGPGV